MYKSYDDLLLMMSVQEVADVLGISKSSAFVLVFLDQLRFDLFKRNFTFDPLRGHTPRFFGDRNALNAVDRIGGFFGAPAFSYF